MLRFLSQEKKRELCRLPCLSHCIFAIPSKADRLPGNNAVCFSYPCKPIPHVLVDFWQANDRGQYDNAGYRLRGHQFTDDAGRYHLETVVRSYQVAPLGKFSA